MPDYTAQWAQTRAEARAQARERAKKKRAKAAAQKIKGTILPESKISTVEFAVIGMIALVSDTLDYFGVDLLSLHLLDICTTAILGFWCLFRLKKFPSARFAFTFIIELIPGLGFSPTWTIFVATVFAQQRGYLPKIKLLNKFIKK